jgi:hypothetical protein
MLSQALVYERVSERKRIDNLVVACALSLKEEGKFY